MLLDDKRDLQLERTLAADAPVLPSKGKTVAAEDKAQRMKCDYLIASKWPKADRKRFQIDINMIRMYQKPCWHFIKQRRLQPWLVQLKALWTVLRIKQSSFIQRVYAGTLATSACTFVTASTMPSEGSHCKVVSSSLFITFHDINWRVLRTSQHACTQRTVVLPSGNSHALQNKHLLRDKSSFALSMQDLSIR